MEYAAPASYQTRAAMEPWHIFAIEVTSAALRSGATATACAAVKEGLGVLQQEARARVSIVTYDHRVHFYSVAGDSGAARCIVMSDVAVRTLSCPQCCTV